MIQLKSSCIVSLQIVENSFFNAMGLLFIIVTVLGPKGQISGKNIISLKTKIHVSLKQKEVSAYLYHDSLSQSYLYSMDSKLKYWNLVKDR